MTVDTVFILLAIGLFGGAWNVVAGGATLITFPALIAAGLPPVIANATNYLALLPSNLAALPAYRQELCKIGAAVWPLVIVSGLGAIVGSLLLMISNPAVFIALIPFLILFATCLFAFGDTLRRWLLYMTGDRTSHVLTHGLLFVFSIYGGYFGAGLGIILLAIVQMMGFSAFHLANSLKNLLAASFTILSILIFGLGGLIAWPEAATMMCGSSIGGYIGGRYAKLINERYLRVCVVIFGLILSAVYFVKTLGG